MKTVEENMITLFSFSMFSLFLKSIHSIDAKKSFSKVKY
jgi:hypothetical protein